MTTPTLAVRIAETFLLPALNMGGEEHHERWKAVNRAAGMIVGGAVAIRELVTGSSGLTEFSVLGVSRIAENLQEAAISALRVEIENETEHHPDKITMITVGLRKRVAECLRALGETEP